RPPRRQVHVRSARRTLRARGSRARSSRTDRARRRHRQRARHGSCRSGPARDRPRRPRRGRRRPSSARPGQLRVRRPVRMVPAAGRGSRVSERLDYDSIRADTVAQVAKLMAAAAITAPKSGGQLFLAGKPTFMETVIVAEPDARHELAEWLRARGVERRETIWFRDAEVAEAVDAILFVGIADWYPPNYDCGACGYATCAEF